MIRRALILLIVMGTLSSCGGVQRVPYTMDAELRALTANLEEIVRDQEYYGSILGGSLIVEARGKRVFERHFGRKIPGGDRIDDDTLFDVSSLTKVAAAIPVAKYISTQFAEELPQLMLMMSHRSGLCDEQNYPEQFSLALMKESLLGERCFDSLGGDCYSNAAYVLASLWLQERHKLLEAAQQFGTYSPLPEECAVSGIQQNGEWIRGRQYDPLADFQVHELGMVPLHSGLFATSEQICDFGTELLRSGRGDFLHPVTPEVNRCPGASDDQVVFRSPFGIESPTQRPSARPDSRPGRYFVQTGYTGCVLWLDAGTDTVVVFLTNASATESQEEWREMAADIIESVWRTLS